MAKRLFLAVDLDQTVRDALGRIASELRLRLDPHVRMSWVKPDRMHLTLHFFGDADAAAEERISRSLREPIAYPPFDVTFNGLGTFPERGSPRVLWVGVRDGGDALQQVQAIAKKQIGLRAGDEFRPHLTLARYRDRVRRAEIEQILTMSAVAGPSRIDRVTLYESRLSPKGPTYIRLAEAPLKS